MLRNKTTIFFDMDGLLFATEKIYYETRRDILKEYDIHFEMEDYLPYMGRGFDDTIRRLSTLLKDEKLGRKVFHEAMDLYYERIENDQFEIKPGVMRILKYFKKSNKKCYITSSSDYNIIERIIISKGLESYFDGYIGGDQVIDNKPAPDIYLHALRSAGSTVEESVIYEDSISGIKSAKAANIDVIGVPDLLQPNDYMRKNTKVLVDQIDETIQMFENNNY